MPKSNTMKTTNNELIEELIEATKDMLNRAQAFTDLTDQQLNKKQSPESWSILECIEHLNRYGDFYIPEISKRLKTAKPCPTSQTFKSSWLGEYFAQSMKPKAKLNKMKTFTVMNPKGSKLDRSVLQTFAQQQRQMLDLLQAARTVDMTKTKTSISISSFIKLRLGDTFRVVIYHNQRHLEQAEIKI